MRYLVPFCGLLFLFGCNGNDPAPDDGGVKDAKPPISDGDAGPVADVGPGRDSGDGPLADLGPDGPKAPAKWKTIQDPAPQVDDHTVTLLKNGDVLIVGGNKYDGANQKDDYQATAYRFIPSTEKFESAGTMSVARGDHVAALLTDGRVLVLGGKNNTDYLQSTEIYDPSKPAAQAWSKGPDMFKSRWSHTATTLQDGKVLVAGGFTSSDSTDSVIRYNPASNSFETPKNPLNEARRGHVALLLSNGKVVFAGGYQGSGSIWNTTYLDSIEIHDPGTGAMTLSKAKMSKQRGGHSATLLADGTVLIVGGVCLNDCKATAKQVNDIYDPGTDTVAPLAHAGDLPSTHVAARLKDNRVLVAGDTDKATADKVLAYDPKGGGFWTVLPKLAFGRWSAKGTLLDDGTVLVVGGITDSNPYTYAAQAERFYP